MSNIAPFLTEIPISRERQVFDCIALLITRFNYTTSNSIENFHPASF